jgi:hypothetical protein|tara:strand:- start:839 stop:1072 length:234 start_codon:yes stop_codon:yes gene_type:complete
MKNLEKTKMIFGYILIGYSIIGIIVALSYQFDWDWFEYDYRTFGRGDEGGASNSPIFYGLSAIAGAILLATVKKEEK